MVTRKLHRVVLELTTRERKILRAVRADMEAERESILDPRKTGDRVPEVARADAEAEKDSILEQAREAINAWQETRQVVDVLIANLKAERER